MTKSVSDDVAEPAWSCDPAFYSLMKRIRAAATVMDQEVSAEEWSQLETYLSENLITEDRIMKEYEAGKSVGITQARSAIKKELLDRACACFRQGKDGEANGLRDLANSLIPEIGA